MNWLLGVVTKNPAVMIYIAVAAFTTGIVAGGIPAWKYQGALKDAAVAEYKSFVAQTKTIGEAAKKEAEIKEAQGKLNKEIADENQKQLMARNADLAKRLLDARTHGSYLPAAAASSGHPERACFNRAKLDGAIRYFDEGVSGLVKTGDDSRIGLDTGKRWVRER